MTKQEIIFYKNWTIEEVKPLSFHRSKFINAIKLIAETVGRNIIKESRADLERKGEYLALAQFPYLQTFHRVEKYHIEIIFEGRDKELMIDELKHLIEMEQAGILRGSDFDITRNKTQGQLTYTYKVLERESN